MVLDFHWKAKKVKGKHNKIKQKNFHGLLSFKFIMIYPCVWNMFVNKIALL